MDNGQTTKRMATACTLIPTELDTKDNGKMICKTVSALKPGATVPNSKGTISWARSTVKVPTAGQMGPNTLEVGSKIKFRGTACTLGWMEEDMKENG